MMQLYKIQLLKQLFHKITIVFFLLLLAKPSLSQPKDLVQIHTDQSFYFSGDTIWMSVSVQDTGLVGTNTKWIQSFLLTSEKAVVAEAKIKITNRKGWCYMVIDSLAKSGTYTMYAFSPFTTVGTKLAICKPIVICNLNNYQVLLKSPIDTITKLIVENKGEDTRHIKSKVNAQLSKLDNYEWQIKLTDQLGDAFQANFSISIIDSALSPLLNMADSIAEVQSLNAIQSNGKGLNVVGEVKFKNNVPSELNEIVLVDSANTTFVRHQIFGNQSPKFTIPNMDIEGNATLYLELKKNYEKEFDIVFQKDSFDFKFAFPQIPLVDVERLVLFKKLEKAFMSQSHSSIQKTIINQPIILTTADDRIIYDFTKYMEFKTIQESMSEIIGVVKIRSKKGKTSIKVSDGERKMFFDEEPLFIIDGIPSYNSKVLFDLDPADVKTIEVLHPKNILPQWRGVGRHGIIDVHTILGDFIMGDNPNRKKIDFKGYNFSMPKTPFIPVFQSNYPDFRPRLFWNPDLQTDANGKVKIQFLPNHNSSNYYFLIKGKTVDEKFFELKDRKSTRLNSSHSTLSRMPSSA